MNQEARSALGGASSAQEMVEHPLIFTFQDTITGHGFQAGVKLHGRGLMVKESDGKWWLYGVRPGAITESGHTWEEAYLRFRRSYQELLNQFASEADSYGGFKKELTRFFNQTDSDAQRWDIALACVRAGNSVPRDFQKLPRARPKTPSLAVIQIQRRQLAPKINAADSLSQAA